MIEFAPGRDGDALGAIQVSRRLAPFRGEFVRSGMKYSEWNDEDEQ